MDCAKIMIVEDNIMVAEDLRHCLQDLGYQVTAVVASGEESVERAEKDRPDVVMMDIHLRDEMDGIEAAERIHCRFEIPVVFLSAYSDRDLLHRAKRVGSFGYLVKPFDERELHATLEMALYKSRAEKEAKRMQGILRQAQKMEGLRVMAGAVAHRFNNYLAVVMGNLELLMEELPREGEVAEQLSEALEGARRAAEVSGLMLTYLGQCPGNREPLDLARLCEGMRPMIGALVSEKTDLSLTLPSPGPAVSADEGQIRQVLAHLVVNARESLSDGEGSISISVKAVSSGEIPEDHRFPVREWIQAPRYACLEVKDTGSGISPEDMEKIFDPFFSTKFIGRGLGLPVVLGIVEAHEGGVVVESRQGEGSVFRVFLPLCEKCVVEPLDEVHEAPPLEGGGTVLLVEDQEMVRKMAAAMLARLGMTVLQAGDGVEAVETFRRHGKAIRCVVCDLTMPRMGGWETLAAIRRLDPGVPAILASGYDEIHVMEGEHEELPQAFLKKPYRLDELRATLARVTAGDAS